MPGPTPPGTRVGSWKYQAGAHFTRGQPVYLASPGTYALASLSTGFDGLVGDIDTNRFELVLSGELDGLILSSGSTYSLSATPGQLVVGTSYPVMKASSADVGAIVQANVGGEGTEVVLPYTFSVSPLGGAVPLARDNGTLAPGWIPELDYLTDTDLTQHNTSFHSHDPYFVRSPEGGGILDIDEGSLVFDVDSLTQVLDEGFA